MIDRRNILNLIGKHPGKYHSCVLTCYSLDFSYFEERVLPMLRLANIKNVNVLADGHCLEIAQEETTGKEFRYNKTYNFQPVYEKGCFHPKILLITGPKHGLLVLGSGNITSSGLSTNDEIWGAFHLDNLENENAPLFGAVWNYLQPYLGQAVGFIPQKIDWIRKYSPWLNELPIAKDWITLGSLGIRARLLASTPAKSTFTQLTQALPKQKVEALTVIAPYYDKEGAFISQLKAHYEPAITNCVVEPNSGLLPINLNSEVAEEIVFYNWANCKKDFERTYNRLHAKVLHFTTGVDEYMLLGSANATIAGMGNIGGPTENAEAGLLIHRKRQDKTWLQELNIHLPEDPVPLSAFPQGKGLNQNTLTRASLPFRILYSELTGNVITIYTHQSLQAKLMVNIQDRAGLRVHAAIKSFVQNRLVIESAEHEQIFKLCLEDEGGNRLSNYSIVHRLEALLRCNPDPQQQRLDEMLDQEFPDGEGITDLLQFVEHDWADDEINNSSNAKIGGMGRAEKTRKDAKPKEYETLSEQEFNKVSEETMLRHSGELSSPNVKIAEFLHTYTYGIFGRGEDFEESEEQKLLEDMEQKGDGKEANATKSRPSTGSKEKAALIEYFKKLDHHYDKQLKNFVTTQALTKAPVTPITIRSLSSILIALHLIQLRYGRRFTVISQNQDEGGPPRTKQETFLETGPKGPNVDTLKGFLFNVLGKFLLLSTAGTKEYEYEILNQKFHRSLKQLLAKSVALILNTPWRDGEENSRDILLLNSLYFSLRERMLEEGIIEELLQKIEHYRQSPAYICQTFGEQLSLFKQDLLPTYMSWLKKFACKEVGRKELFFPSAQLKQGRIIFNSKIGFNIVYRVKQENGSCLLHLCRAGYPWLNEEFALTSLQYPQTSIIFP